MLDSIVDVRTPRILLLVRNAFGGAYASFNNYPTGADLVLALPTTRVAVMGPAARSSSTRTSSARCAPRRPGWTRRPARRWLKAREAELNARYERSS
jgi:acetyl-CoA carboxylase carboxyltransferase component